MNHEGITMKNTSRMFTRWAAVAATLIATIAVVLFGLSQSSSADRHWRGGEHRYVCHPVNGNGNLGNGWDLIRPAEASSHIDEALYPSGHYWKHESRDGRHDVYAVGRTCPTTTVTPTVTPTITPTVTPTVTPTPTPTPTSTAPACPPLTQAHFVRGTHRADTLTGTDCRDVILGHGGDDTMFGLAGVDTILGGRGNDRLIGGPDGDILRGGLGRDTCIDAHRTIFISCERIRYTD